MMFSLRHYHTFMGWVFFYKIKYFLALNQSVVWFIFFTHSLQFIVWYYLIASQMFQFNRSVNHIIYKHILYMFISTFINLNLLKFKFMMFFTIQPFYKVLNGIVLNSWENLNLSLSASNFAAIVELNTLVEVWPYKDANIQLRHSAKPGVISSVILDYLPVCWANLVAF